MNRNLNPKSAAAYVASASGEFDSIGVATADVDAVGCADIFLGMPTPGQVEVLKAYDRAKDELSTMQRIEMSEATSDAHAAAAELREAQEWSDLDNVPALAPPVPRRRLRALQCGIIGVLGTETVLLANPMNETLRGGIGHELAGINFTLTGVGAAVAVTGLGAFMAGARAEAADDADNARDVATRTAAEASANRATVGLLFAASAPVVARLYAASLDPDGIDASGVAFFVVLQVVFLFAALTLPQMILRVKRSINRMRTQRATTLAAGKVERTKSRVADLEKEHLSQPARLENAAVGALNTYLGRLATSHPNASMGDLVRVRLAEAHQAGTLRALVRGADATQNAHVDAGDDATADAGGTPDFDPQPDRKPGDGGAGGEVLREDDSAHAGSTVSERRGSHRLLDDILNNRKAS